MRVAFRMKLKAGFKEEYKKRHDELWPELKILLKEQGVSNYSIFFDEETNILFGVQEQEGESSSQDLGTLEIVKKWWAFMADIMETNADNSPVTASLDEVFYME
ncbi:MAG: L-rhamnose mutarotase [Bacteroidetes bacterium]|nr:MAG: L-rhamnose mutarotase [Bacteroidota bacterium]